MRTPLIDLLSADLQSLFGIWMQHNVSFFAKKIIKIEFNMNKKEI